MDHIQIAQEWLSNKATVPRYEPRSPLWLPALPWMRRAGPSAPCRKGICETETNFLTCKKMGKLHQWLTCFQVATERCRNSCKKCHSYFIHCCFLPPLSGLPEGYRSYLPRMPTCPPNNRQPVNLLETKIFYMIWIYAMMNQFVPVQSLMKSWHFLGCNNYFWGGHGLYDLRLRDQNKNMLSVHVVSLAKPITLSGWDISNLNGSPGLPPPPGKF